MSKTAYIETDCVTPPVIVSEKGGMVIRCKAQCRVEDYVIVNMILPNGLYLQGALCQDGHVAVMIGNYTGKAMGLKETGIRILVTAFIGRERETELVEAQTELETPEPDPTTLN